MLGARLIPGLMLDEFVVDNAEAVTREHAQNLTVALVLFYHRPARARPGLIL